MKRVRQNSKAKVSRQKPAQAPKPSFSIPAILLEGDYPPISLPALPALVPETGPKAEAQPITPPPVPQAQPGPVAAEATQHLLPPAPEVKLVAETVTPSAPEAAPAPPEPRRVPAPLPEAYGTERLLLAPRNPQWLYAHWDLTRDQLEHYNALSPSGHLTLRIYQEHLPDRPCNEIQVHPESRNWFVHVSQPGQSYFAQLGYYPHQGTDWRTITTSTPITTPPASLSPETTFEFGTLPPEEPSQQPTTTTRTIAFTQEFPPPAAGAPVTLSQALPESGAKAPVYWSPEQERALAQLVQYDESRLTPIGSLEIVELIQRLFLKEVTVPAVGELRAPEAWSGALPAVTQPEAWSAELGAAGKPGAEKPFWFNVNAELVVYGATEPDAKVTIGGRTIRLRPDGTFSFRFALPDGQYTLPTTATSADGIQNRKAELHFNRKTHYQGDVGMTPQAPDLKAPLVENVA